MANKIILKKTSTASKVPLASDLEVGEIAVNLADQKLYSKNASGTVVLVGQGVGGSGDVVGPSSATDNALVRFDSTTGKLIQNSVVTVSDTGAIAGAESISNLDFAQFDTTVTPVEAVAKMQWDDGNGTLQLGLKGGNVNLQIGQEIVARVYNDSGVALTDGQIVYIAGAQGNRVAVKLALADSDTTSAGTLGMVTEPIAIGAEGFITILGTVNGLNTIGLTQGAIVYLSPTVAGAYTTTKPIAPQHTVTIGYVERVHATVGSIYVKVDNGYELDELHNVLITSPTSGNTLIYDAVQGVWENANISAGTGISVTNGAGSITVANTGVTSVSGTAPISSSGGATPAISISQSTTSTNGYLSSTDWNTFNGKQATLVSGTNIKTVNGTTLLGSGNLAVGTVTSVSATVPTGLSIAGSPITGSGTLAITYSAGYAIPTTASQTNWDTAYSDRLKWDGGATGLTASTGRTSLGGTTVGQNFFTLTNPTAVTFPRMNADNTVSALDAATFRTAIGAGTGSGTVTGVTATSPVASSGGTAPVISLSAGYGDTLNPYASKTANYILAAPNGTAGVPTFRAMVAADVPTLNQNTTGSAATLTTGRTIAITGDLTYTSPSFNGSANVTAAGTLATVNANVGSFGSSTSIPVVTVNAKGLVTAVSTATVSGGQYFGTAATKAIAYNANSISENITVTAGNNGLSAGPITISTGFAVTVATGANWVIV